MPNNAKLFAQLKKLHTISAKRPPKKKAPVSAPTPTLPSTLPPLQPQLPQPQTQPPQPQLYGQYSGLTSISPTFGHPQGAVAGNRTAMNSPSSQWKAQITKDTMSGLQDYNTPKQSDLGGSGVMGNNNDEGWADIIEDRRSEAEASRLGKAYDDTLEDWTDYSKAKRNRGEPTPDSPNLTWHENSAYNVPADVGFSGAFGGVGGLFKHLKNSLYYLRNPFTASGLGKIVGGGGKGMTSPTNLLRGTAFLSPITDAIGWRSDINSANTAFDNAHEAWVEAGGVRSGRPEPNVETFYENITATRGDQILDWYAANNLKPSTGVVDNLLWKDDPKDELNWLNQIGGRGGQKLMQALGMYLGPHQYDAMGRSARKPFYETIDANRELVKNNPAYLASLIYGTGKDGDYDFSNMSPPQRDNVQEAYWRNDQNKQIDKGNLWERYVTNPISRWVADPDDQYGNTTSRIITSTLEQVHIGKMTPEQRQHILSRVGVDIASEEVVARDRELQARLNKKDRKVVEEHMAAQGRLANKNKEDQAGIMNVQAP